MEKDKYKYKVLTIPNVLSLLRIALIPFFIWFYLRGDVWISFAVLILSGLTDVVDGRIARKFGMVSNVGRILDPAADKLTQIAILAVLCIKYRQLIVLVAVLVVKELANGIIGLVMMHKNRDALDSRWHGKLTTVLLYITIAVHLLWPAVIKGTEMPKALSYSLIAVCLVMMVVSFVLYTINNIRIIKEAGKKEE